MTLSPTLAAGLLLLAGTATATAEDRTYPRVSIEQLVADPQAWDGRWVEVRGLVVREFENIGLYSSFEAYCPRVHGKAIYVRWGDHVRGFSPSDELRMVVVRGRFTNAEGSERRLSDGQIEVTISTGAAGPGPLEDAVILSRSPTQSPRCPR